MNNVTPNIEKQRIEFSEYHYTCLESLISIKLLVEKPLQEITCVKDSLGAVNDLIIFIAHAGRIKDMIEKMCYLLLSKTEAEKLINKLNDFYQQRNTVIHGKKIPYGIEDGFYKIVKPKGASENLSEWDSSFHWNSVSEGDLIFLNDFFEGTFKELIKETNDVLSNIKDFIFNLKKANNLFLSHPPDLVNVTGVSSFSGLHGSSGIGGKEDS